MHDYMQALQGGILIGLASWILLAGAGRISSVGTITSGVVTTRHRSSGWRWAFLFGLAGGGALFAWLLPVPHVAVGSLLVLVPAGFMVGFGTVLGSGCTYGHGACGLGRRSKQSLVAVLTFMGAGIATVLVTSLLAPALGWESTLFDGSQWLFRAK